MATKAVEKREEPSVPDLVRTPALSITAEDVALPRIYIGQFMSKAVQDQLVKAGVIYAATGQEDPDPQVLWSPGDEDGVRFYVLTLRKGKSISDGGELQLFDYDDPSAPPEAWVTYNYVVFVPNADDEVPCKLLLTRTGKNAALNINTVLKRTATHGPAWITAFSLKTAERQNQKGKFWVPRVSTTASDPEEVDKAGDLYVQLSAQATEFNSTGEEPAI